MKKIKYIISALVILFISGCSAQESKFSESFLAFDTYINVTVYSSKEADANVYLEEAKALYESYHKKFDAYNNYNGLNNIKTINDQAGKAPVVVDQDIFDLIKQAKELYEQGNTKNNIALYPVTQLYTQKYNEYEAGKKNINNPTSKQLKSANKCVSVDNIQLDNVKKTVFLKEKCNKIDVGSTAKGYVTALVAKKLQDDGLKSGLINAGGNVVAINSKPDKSNYVIGIANPDSPSEYNVTLSIANKNVVTSGDYQRYYMVDGKRMHHLIDPDTLKPGNLHRSVTVVSDNGLLADYFSTDAFLLPTTEIEKLSKKYNFEYIIIDKDEKVTVSDGIKDAVEIK
ncbi:FAD:protein FMN transferase [Mycoplasma sp. P36-A1]|uniref:FAD:protein FMN transferase n=1 Tax=Mycoplasma sp. P36-A1 TaxID=3252900 RepID=UPI003C3011B6